MPRLSRFSLILLAVVIGASVSAQGLLIPVDSSLPPLAIRSHHVAVNIDNQGASTTLEQVFENNTGRQLEGNYLFPIPRGAAISKFTMLVNGVEKKGEMLEKKEARQIYNSIVARAQDPGLLEYVGQDLFRASVFPILPHSTQKITVTYIQVLPKESEFISYSYPLKRSEKQGPAVREDFRLSVSIKSPVPVKSVYSPTHAVMVDRPSELEARVRFQENQAALDKDFQLYYSVSDKNVGLNVAAHRPGPDKSKPGYFMMLISPKSKLQQEQIVKRDIIFVVDNSASMAGDKMAQTRDALKFCVQKLNDGDRFNIVKFSTDIEPWKSQLVKVGEAREAAINYIDTIEPEGGTNIDGALKAALSYPKDPARPYIVIFMTDGKPTIGETIEPRQILKNVQAAQSQSERNVRIFTWGVGFDLDTHLLDAIAESGGGVSEYVKPKEDIAQKVAAFFNKASQPVMTDLRLQVMHDKIQLVNVYPKKLPDLYAGTQMVVFGQYIGDGPVALQLTGNVNDRTEKFTYETEFPAAETKHAFIEPLWAKRRIGHLLDTIRQHGEAPELVQDVIRLSKEYGIQTPYTSYLVLDDGMQVPTTRPRPPGAPIAEGGGRRGEFEKDERRADKLRELAGAAGLEPRKSRLAADAAAPAPSSSGKAGGFGDRQAAEQQALELAYDLGNFEKKDGKAGVAVARYLQRLKKSEMAQDNQLVSFRKAGPARFVSYNDMWVDDRFEDSLSITHVKFGGDGYFELLDEHPELAEVFKIGTTLIYVTANGKAVLVSSKGAERLTAEQIAALFKPR